MCKLLKLSEYREVENALNDSTMYNGKLVIGQHVSTSDLLLIYKFFRRSMLDGYIPINKPIGYYIDKDMNNSSTIISRNPCLLEANMKIVSNLSKVIFTDCDTSNVIVPNLFGRVRSGNLNSKEDKSIKVLDPTIDLFSSLSPIKLVLLVMETTGYRLMEKNMKRIQKVAKMFGDEQSSYIPLNIDSSLIEYINILPFNGIDIRYTLLGNISELDMNKLWKRHLSTIKERGELFE